MNDCDRITPVPSVQQPRRWGRRIGISVAVFLVGLWGCSVALQWHYGTIVDELQSRKISVLGGTLLNWQFGMSVAPKLPETYGPFLFFAQGILADKSAGCVGIRENDLLLISKLKNVIQADFWEIKVSDSGLAQLAELPHLKRINFIKTGTTDAGALELARVRELRNIYFHDVPIGDEGVRHLAKLPRLTALVLNKTRISDRGLETLQLLPNLDYLDLSDNEITDEGLTFLLKCQKLERVDLRETKCTKAGIAKFKSEHPNRALSVW